MPDMDSYRTRFLIAICSSIILGVATSQLSRLNAEVLAIIWFSSVLTLYMRFIYRSRKKLLFMFAIPFGLVFITISTGLIFRAEFALWIVNNIYNTIIWVMGYLAEIAVYDPVFAHIAMAALLIVIVPVTYILAVKRRYISLTAFNSSLIVLFWAAFNGHINVVTIISFCILSVLLIMENVRLTRQRTDNQEYHDGYVYMQWIIPICITISLIAAIIPASHRPIQWKWLDDLLFPRPQYQISQLDPFNLGRMGYGKEDRLGGIAEPTDDVALVVRADKPVYLKAQTKDRYTGTRWENSDPSAHILESENSSLSIEINQWDDAKKYGRLDALGKMNTNVTIRFENVLTKNVFYPVMFQRVRSGRTGLLWSDSGSGLLMMFRRSKGFTYTINSDIPDFGSEAFRNILRTSAQPMDVSSQMYRRYTSLPDSLPSRVKDLALSLTAEASTLYDKVSAIEKYLNENFTYTFEPPELPEGWDFTDHFLFDGKKGYCTYFATAMTVLLRCAGIPARYTEGYAMPLYPYSRNNYIVTNMEAHAWPEVYFPGIGWVPFEPTPAFRSRLYWQEENSGGSSSGSGLDYIEELPEDMEEDPGEFEIPDFAPVYIKILRTLLYVVLILISLALVIYVLSRFNRYRRSRFRDNVRRYHPAKSCRTLFYYYLKILFLCGYSRKFNETVREFANRIYEFVTIDVDGSGIREIAGVFDKARYGNGKMEVWEMRLMLDSYEKFLEFSNKKLGKIKAFILGDILGLF